MVASVKGLTCVNVDTVTQGRGVNEVGLLPICASDFYEPWTLCSVISPCALLAKGIRTNTTLRQNLLYKSHVGFISTNDLIWNVYEHRFVMKGMEGRIGSKMVFVLSTIRLCHIQLSPISEDHISPRSVPISFCACDSCKFSLTSSIVPVL